MKIIDSKGKFFGKISIVDLFAVILVLACIFFVGLKFKTDSSIHSGNRKIVYTVRIENVRDVTCDAIKNITEEIVDTETKYSIGKIVNVNVSDYKGLIQTNDGEWSIETFPDKYTVDLTIEVLGTETEIGYFAESGKQIIVGDMIGIKSELIETSGEVTSLEVEE